MKNQKMIMVLIAAIVVIVLAVGFLSKYNRMNHSTDKPIVNGHNGTDTDDTNHQKTEDITISPEEAMQLATEQIDINEFTVSLSDKTLDKDGEHFYLIDVVNKSGPSFGTQMAINKRTGDFFAYEPDTDELMSMSEFPIVTPIAQQQDWNGVFVPADDSMASKGVSIELMQADQNQFEFRVIYQNGEDSTFYDIATIDGSKANYKGESGYELVFMKNGDGLGIIETGEGPLSNRQIKLSGEYVLKK